MTGYTTVVEKYPRILLVLLFSAWKILLLAITLFSPGPDYDTSTQLLFNGHGTWNYATVPQVLGQIQSAGSLLSIERLVERLTRWDAIYFVPVAERGYVHEQEWAFGWGFTRLLSLLSKNLPITSNSLHDIAVHGIILAHVSHLLSVLILYQIGLAVVSKKTNKSTLSFIAAALHIISPAGIFLVAPYTEAPFAFLNFLGQLLYVHSWNSEYGLVQDMALATSGICFGLSATIRGNGLLSGIILFADVVIWAAVKVERALQIRVLNVGRLNPSLQAQMRVIKGRRIPATIIAGLFVGLGFVIPQYVAYQDFCNSSLDEVRPWCHRLPPSIYSWVQNHYWNVGLFKYWTLSNAPLFLIASPVLYLMLKSAWQTLEGRTNINKTQDIAHITQDEAVSKPNIQDNQQELRADALLFRLALPQLALASAALTTFHVQVITRLSSGYPLWYLVLAQDVIDDKRVAKWVVRWFVMYSIIQAVLFVAFLPPA